MPRSVEVVLQGQLVDSVKPGDRVQISGVYKCLASAKTVHCGIFNTKLIATSVKSLNEDVEQLE